MRIHIDEGGMRTAHTMFYECLLQAIRRDARHTTEARTADIVISHVDGAGETNWPIYGMRNGVFLQGEVDYFGAGALYDLVRFLDRQRGRKVLVVDMNTWSEFRSVAGDNPDVILAEAAALRPAFRDGHDISFPASPVIRFDPGQAAGAARPLLASFCGTNTHPVRERLRALHEDGRIEVVVTERAAHAGRISVKSGLDQPEVATFARLLLGSEFSLVPRGDGPFSYRLLESMAAGAIPVVLSDGWVLPFEGHVDWEGAVLRWPEDDVTGLPAALEAIPPPVRAEMRQKGAELYRRFFAGFDLQVATMLDILEARLG